MKTSCTALYPSSGVEICTGSFSFTDVCLSLQKEHKKHRMKSLGALIQVPAKTVAPETLYWVGLVTFLSFIQMSITSLTWWDHMPANYLNYEAWNGKWNFENRHVSCLTTTNHSKYVCIHYSVVLVLQWHLWPVLVELAENIRLHRRRRKETLASTWFTVHSKNTIWFTERNPSGTRCKYK